MIFTETPLKGAFMIDLEKRGDERGFFARAYCEQEFGKKGLVTRFVQVNNSLSAQKGALRGMHYQLAPKAETKVVRCIRGCSMTRSSTCGKARRPSARALVPSCRPKTGG